MTEDSEDMAVEVRGASLYLHDRSCIAVPVVTHVDVSFAWREGQHQCQMT